MGSEVAVKPARRDPVIWLGLSVGLAICSLLLAFGSGSTFDRVAHAIMAGALGMAAVFWGGTLWYMHMAAEIRKGRRS